MIFVGQEEKQFRSAKFAKSLSTSDGYFVCPFLVSMTGRVFPFLFSDYQTCTAKGVAYVGMCNKWCFTALNGRKR